MGRSMVIQNEEDHMINARREKKNHAWRFWADWAFDLDLGEVWSLR